ncbi:MAG: LamG-like jellyroll fold domain-containing protein [Thermoguttaceae bacterium]
MFVLVAAVWGAANEPDKEPAGSVQPLALAKRLVAHWTFDEPFGVECLDASGNGHHASPEAADAAGLDRTDGVFGGAINLSGRHKLQIPGRLQFGTISAISLCAWVLPEDLSAYREIFRKEDGEQRVLFSFQHDGTILSLGLNIGGYVECDARIDPARVLDGAWHHCAATFDGRFMRVYLDGRQVGSVERPGRIAAHGTAPGCIGSLDGGECFQGAIDDLRIYQDPLTAQEIARLYQNGMEALAAAMQPGAGGEPRINRRLLAHWTFNGQGPAVLREESGNPANQVKPSGRVLGTRGVHGQALELRGEHALQVGAIQGPDRPGITFSAWTRPTDLSGFREIFRQECPNRLLFSFQENGSILSLGLNIGGYVECDAAIDPRQVLDGAWHHCAATFDGQFMRVYLDGRQIGLLERPGRIAIQPGVPAFIGSNGGGSEFFQGSLDDLRIYEEALTPEEVARIYRSGIDRLARLSQQLDRTLQSIYAPRKSFAETLAECRKALAEKGMRPDRDLAGALAARIKADFPEAYQKFTSWTGASPIQYLLAPDDQFHVRHTQRLVELMLEYKPLTPQQWKKQSAEQLQKWQKAEAIQKRLEALKAQGQGAWFSPEWIEIILAAGPLIDFRPVVHEAVAPYVRPETPQTRDLSPAEAQEALQRDWLHQADQNPTPERIRSEIVWTRELAGRIAAEFPGRVDFATQLEELQRLEQQAASLAAADRQVYFKVRELKRQIALANPVVDFDKVLFVDMPFPQGSEWRHETRHRLGYMAVPGGRLLILEGLSPAGRLTQLMPQPPLHGSFWRPDLSYEADKVLFCFKPHNEKSFHLYEIGVDGTWLVQLTDGPYDDLDPIYLPDGQHILFSTTRAHTYVRCMPPTNAYVLARCDRDGKNIYLISANNEPDYLPSVMNDGRVIYTRWEYTDKPLWRAQKLWTINPDGTQVLAYWGNQSVWPDLVKDARSIPGSRRVIVTGSAHHDWFSGSLAIIDPDRGFNFPAGITKITAEVPWPEVGNGPVDPIHSPRYHRSGHYPAYYSPYPLGEHDFLVSAERGGKFVLYLMDVDGNRELIYEGVHHIFHAMPLKPRPRPPGIADRVVWPDREKRLAPAGGVLYSGNVYQNAPAVLRGKARFLRVLQIDPKTYTLWYKRPYISTGPVVSAVQSEGVKRLLGTVPIEPDGSVAFHAPSGRALHFQLLDENQQALQTMRSFVGLMPGERRGCLGCHESHSRAPLTEAKPMALAKPPQPITPPPWGEDTVSYVRYVQPVLDQYCGKCHQGDGEARKTLDLTLRPDPLFAEPYLTLIGRPTWGAPYVPPDSPPPGFGIADMLMVEGYSTTDPAGYRTPAPMTKLSFKSRLIDLASSGNHYGVKVDPVSLQRLIAWVDTMCPFLGDEEVRQIPDPVFQGVEWLAIRPRIHSAPRIIRPGPVDD